MSTLILPSAGARAIVTDQVYARALPNVSGATVTIDIAAIQTAMGSAVAAVQILGVRGRYTTNATAGSRFVNPNYQAAGGLVVWQYGARTAQLASLTVAYSFAPGWAGPTDVVNVATGVGLLPIPEPTLITSNGGEFLQLSASGGVAGDAWASLVVQLLVLGA